MGHSDTTPDTTAEADTDSHRATWSFKAKTSHETPNAAAAAKGSQTDIGNVVQCIIITGTYFIGLLSLHCETHVNGKLP